MGTCEYVIHLNLDYLTLHQGSTDGSPMLGQDIIDYEVPILEEETSLLREDTIDKILSDFKIKFPDFKHNQGSPTLLESSTLSLELGKDEWSLTLKLSSKESVMSENLQDELFNVYLEGLQESILNHVDDIYVVKNSYLTETLARDTFNSGIKF